MRTKKKIIKEAKRLEELILSHKWKRKDGILLNQEQISLNLYRYGLKKSYMKEKGFKSTYKSYITYLKNVCDKTNIAY